MSKQLQMEYFKRFKRNNGIKRVCILDSSYALLQYLLLCSEKDIRTTYFFWGNGVSQEVKKYFDGMNTSFPIIKDNPIIKMLLYHVIAPILWPFILDDNIEYWGQDHLHYGSAILRQHKFHLLEDGVLNYNTRPAYKKYVKLRKYLYGELGLSTWTYAGEEKTCAWIHLTGLKDSPILKNHKVVVNKFEDLWQLSSENKKGMICDIYGLNPNILRSLYGVKKILLTEPLSEDHDLTEQEKIDLYRDILNSIGSKEILIKPHPRETTNYNEAFPEYEVLRLRIPMELLSLVNIRFEEAYSLFSTALYNFPYHIKVCYIGCEVHPKLKARYPHSTASNFEVMHHDLEIVKFKERK